MVRRCTLQRNYGISRQHTYVRGGRRCFYCGAVGTLSLKRVAPERRWGTVPPEIAERVQDSKRSRRDTRLSLKEAWRLWPEPFQETI